MFTPWLISKALAFFEDSTKSVISVPGRNLLNSLTQLPTKEVGTTIKTGPAFASNNEPINAITCIVLPSPISSAKQAPSPSLYILVK